MSFFPSQHMEGIEIDRYPEAVVSLSFEILKKFVSCRDLGTKLKLNAYDTLSCFDGIRFCTVPSYFDFIEKLLRSPIGKEYIRYSGKILSIIMVRLEKEYANCVNQALSCNTHVVACFRLIGELIKIKGLLDEEYDGIEAELAKVFMFINSNKVDFNSEILNIGCTVVRAAKSHLKIMDPLVKSFGSIFQKNNGDLTDLYEVFYAYIRMDSSFILHEGKSLGTTSLNFVSGTSNPLTRVPVADKTILTPFRTINEILVTIIKNGYSDNQQPHMSTMLKALLLVILEIQIWNEAGLIDAFKVILDNLCTLLQKVEGEFELRGTSASDKTVILYIWSILALLNAYHYLYEEVSPVIHAGGFIHRFINKGAEIVVSVYPGLPSFLQKVFQIGLIRVFSSSATLGLDIDSISFLARLISDVLTMEIPSTNQEAESVLGSHAKPSNYKKLKKTARITKNGGSRPVSTLTSQLVKEESLIAEVSIVPEHDSKDFYLNSVNMFTYFQRTFGEMKEASTEFLSALKAKLSAEEQTQLNEVLSVSVIQNTTSLVPVDANKHVMKEKPNTGVGVRKIARVARRDPREMQ